MVYGEASKSDHNKILKNTGAKVFIRNKKECWLKVRHMPEIFTTWYPCADRLSGTCVIGDPGDDS